MQIYEKKLKVKINQKILISQKKKSLISCFFFRGMFLAYFSFGEFFLENFLRFFEFLFWEFCGRFLFGEFSWRFGFGEFFLAIFHKH